MLVLGLLPVFIFVILGNLDCELFISAGAPWASLFCFARLLNNLDKPSPDVLQMYWSLNHECIMPNHFELALPEIKRFFSRTYKKLFMESQKLLLLAISIKKGTAISKTVSMILVNIFLETLSIISFGENIFFNGYRSFKCTRDLTYPSFVHERNI